MRYRLELLYVLFAVGAVACDTTGPDGNLYPDVRPWIVDSIRARIDSSGRFILGAPTISSADNTVSPESAAALALAYVKDQLTSAAFRAMVEHDNGSTIDAAALVASDRVEYGTTAYLAPEPDTSAPFRRSVASRYFVRILEHSKPIMSVSVSALATDVSIQNGSVVFPSQFGGEFRTTANPSWAGNQWWYPLGPELAATTVAIATGARIATVPSFVLLDRTFDSTLGRWLVTLDRPVSVRRRVSGSITSTTQIYVGPSLEETLKDFGFYIPQATQPAADSSFPGVVLPLKPGAIIRYDRIDFVK